MTDERRLIERFTRDPEKGYEGLLEQYSSVMLRMIRRLMRDADEVMEVYTMVCERLRANDYQVLRQFRPGCDVLPWLSVLVANACRDRMRQTRAFSAPKKVLDRLEAWERLVFKYYYQDNYTPEEIAHLLSARDGKRYETHEVLTAIEKINDLLTVSKRWHLLAALQMNTRPVSLETLSEHGFLPVDEESEEAFDRAFEERALIGRLNEAIRKLEPEDQLLLLLWYEHGMEAKQVARVMQYQNPAYVYTRLRTVVNQLRRAMEREAEA
ncbi:MAG: sigma-70 family RNA polymerase sigma factor [Bacteroidetes bacterium]|nr:MAG: sigma-70 family RNA polymerase sigma factor [Bacteroidota bacterium]